MPCCKNNKDKKGKKDEAVKVTDFSMDQLGENASEEYKSEDYANAAKNKKNKC